MRMLHTSDWHLGRSFHHVGLLPAQEMFVDHLVDVVRSERVDVVAVAGDVYDRALPAPQTVALLSDALWRITDAGAQVVLASGNHDSAVRLGFGGRLLERSGVHLRTTVADLARPIDVAGTRIYALPYLEPTVVAAELDECERSHHGVLSTALSRVARDAERHEGPVVVLSHAFVTGGEASDSERDIAVGGVGDVPLSLYREADYVGLGHLHGRQTLDERVRYSGSPIAMSFSEARHTKSSWLVDLPERRGEALHVEGVTAPVHTPLAILRGELDELLRAPEHQAAERSYCQVTLTDQVRPLDAIDKVRARFPLTLSLQFDPQGLPQREQASYASRVRVASDLELVDGFLEHVRGGAAASRAEQAVVRQAVEAVRVSTSGEGTR
ncbi:exonuclease SbcCD subunit D [Arsenicicoccus sp. oral taxon 190]|uniref:exonuclease SbcCD subunit D n=1 Tax=Arsenicicoccus sp. oral taxon 190 TaxID=1658671 RepID=UPI00067A2E30|nr:exonuclease SbcCD subunit D [Arsenicicoccus sp. oral taxon 190]AKT51853.1 exonuclease SbcD [Arsenicicoccus sp. oral taxon 190]